MANVLQISGRTKQRTRVETRQSEYVREKGRVVSKEAAIKFISAPLTCAVVDKLPSSNSLAGPNISSDNFIVSFVSHSKEHRSSYLAEILVVPSVEQWGRGNRGTRHLAGDIKLGRVR